MIKCDDKYKFTLGIGISGAGQEEVDTFEGWTGIDEYALSNMSTEDAEKCIEDVWQEWAWEYIDGGPVKI